MKRPVYHIISLVKGVTRIVILKPPLFPLLHNTSIVLPINGKGMNKMPREINLPLQDFVLKNLSLKSCGCCRARPGSTNLPYSKPTF
jgi:hypothetical protein